MRVKQASTITGLTLIIVSVFSFWLFNEIPIYRVKSVGWDCPGDCYPSDNATGMKVDYPSVMKLPNSHPIRIETFIYNLQPDKLHCPALKTNFSKANYIKIDYEANLWTSGLELSPSSPQKTNAIVDLEWKGSIAKWVWIVHPTNPGTYSLHAEVSAQVEGCTVFKHSETFRVHVVDIFGLNAYQIKVISIIILIFGTSLTIPGFVALWIQYKQRKEARESKAGNQQNSPKKVKIIVSSSGQEKEIEIDDDNNSL